MANITMNAKDAVSAKLAECYVTIEGRRYLLMQGKDFEAKFEKTKKEINVLGKTGSGNITIYKNTSIFDELMERYKNTGEDIYFDIQVSNSDPTSAAGVCTMVFSGCNVDGGVLASFDVDGDFLEQKIDFTFEDFSNPTKFTQLAGMQ